MGKSSSRRWIAALRTVWSSCVMRSGGSAGSSRQAAQVEAFDEAGDLRVGPVIGRRAGSEQPGAHVTVAEALAEVLAVEHGGEQGQVRGGRGVEGARRAPVAIAHGPEEAVKRPVSGGGIIDDREGLEVPVVGRGRDGGIAREKRAPFR